jgi:hypothetical protein
MVEEKDAAGFDYGFIAALNKRFLLDNPRIAGRPECHSADIAGNVVWEKAEKQAMMMING